MGADGVDAANEVDAGNLGIGGVPLEGVLGDGRDEGVRISLDRDHLFRRDVTGDFASVVMGSYFCVAG